MRVTPVISSLLAIAVAGGVDAAWGGQEGQQPAAPVFRSGVELIRLDVTVVDENGAPVSDLTADDFEVKVGGEVRPVVTSRFLPLLSGPLELPSGSSFRASRYYSGNDSGLNGRLFVLAVDQETLPTGAGRTVFEAAAKFLDGLGPDDRVALLLIPQPGQRLEFTSNFVMVKEALRRVTGRRMSRVRNFRVSFDEARAFEEGNQLLMSRTLERECLYRVIEGCEALVEQEAQEVLVEGRERIHATLTQLAGVTDLLAGIDGPKTLILLSGGLGYETRALSRFREVGRRAAEARITLYAIHIDSFAFDAAERAASAAFGAEADAGQQGLRTLVGLTGGALFQGIGRSEGVFARISRESSGVYVLGVEPPLNASLSEPLDLAVRVKRRGLTVRTPQQVVPPPPRSAFSDPKRALGYTLRQPRQAAELPIRVTSYTTRGHEANRLKVVIAAEIDVPVSMAADLSWTYEVYDRGVIVADAFDYGLTRGSAAVGSKIVLVTAAQLPPGSYTLRFAAVDGAGRRGSIDHPLDVALKDASPMQMSDLLIGEEVEGAFEPRLEVPGGTEAMSALLELYATDAQAFDDVTVEFDLRAEDGSTRAVTRVTPAAVAAENRRVAHATLKIPSLRPGVYQLNAKVLVGRNAVARVSRPVTIGSGADDGHPRAPSQSQ